MKRILLLTFSLSLILSVSSCKKDNNPAGNGSPDGSGSVIPLKTGNTWIMRTTYYDTTGTVAITVYDTLSVGRDTLIGTDRWYQFGDQRHFWLNKSDGLWRQRVYSTPESPQLIFKYPGNVGDTWIVVETSRSLEVSLTSNSANLTVPAGTFSCYYYRTRGTNSSYNREEDYLKPGVGMIAWDLYLQRSSGLVYKSSRSELSSYTLK